MQFPSHGANFTSLYKIFNLKMPEQVYDLSENVNALGFPPSVKRAWPNLIAQISAYPHPEGEPLKTLLAEKHGVHQSQVLIGNGAAELLTFFAQRFTNKRVMLIHPTFSEYAQTLKAAGAQLVELVVEDVVNYTLPIEKMKKMMKNVDCLYLCNPNNPTGSIITQEITKELLENGKQTNCELLVDEAFMDWTDESESVIPLVQSYSNLTVMRSMTKMYGIAGIRLGYLIGNSEFVQELGGKLPHWNVNGLAIEIGKLCLEDEAFRQESIVFHEKRKKELEAFLHKHGCTMSKSVTNYFCFQLKEPEKTRDFYFYCLEQGVVLRHTENFIGMDGKWLRIGMKQQEAMKKFEQVMDEWNG